MTVSIEPSQTMNLFSVTDPMELLALHRALMEAKFHPNPESREIQGSPFVARIAERVVDALIQNEISEGRKGTADSWTAWRDAAKHDRCLSVAKQRLAETSKSIWESMASDARRAYVRDLLSPLIADDGLIGRLVDEKR